MKIATPNSASRRKSITINCSLCTKTFNRKDNFLRHFRSHTGELPHQCPHPNCKKGFTRSDQLVRHIASKHNETLMRNGSPDSFTSSCSEDSLQTVRAYGCFPDLTSRILRMGSISKQHFSSAGGKSTRMSLDFLLN
ncbi:hypothetical protein K493DRAFT_202159 [Basidiobolus meristosporus CBS 931.73]|uniref:C2H2-type domain-containing protein n=1 Tax=Basidiobolus meristosporus CBS 931.73 TaxID=1314790 RepID=A0A1Y1ZBE7_9FUNG|nr:hypothetical protein K493DRAFT_249334 [Basidiobolus meristosporus CBS 931.73]ORY07434.1 hypothetical protein K493DRAFT_202159 [Basidiobolus meristosporus CBS 931.73]|eukprot:ORX64316.1 hypothetical protein K493DRAFT_249334 [Basidiobolus meristosporus CBS 931.73]